MGRVSQVRTSRQIFFPFWLDTCGLTAQKIVKNCNFLVKICPSGKILGVDRKTWTSVHNYKPSSMQWHHNFWNLCFGMTKFVITETLWSSMIQNRQTNNITFSSTAGARLRIPTILRMVIEEVRPIFAPHNIFDAISSFAARGHWKLVGKAPTARKCL